MKKSFWNVQDLAHETGQSVGTIKSWMYRGWISYIKMSENNSSNSKGAVLFDPEVVVEEIKSFTIERKIQHSNSGATVEMTK